MLQSGLICALKNQENYLRPCLGRGSTQPGICILPVEVECLQEHLPRGRDLPAFLDRTGCKEDRGPVNGQPQKARQMLNIHGGSSLKHLYSAKYSGRKSKSREEQGFGGKELQLPNMAATKQVTEISRTALGLQTKMFLPYQFFMQLIYFDQEGNIYCSH